MYTDKINHFSIRKLSIGAASVLLSTTLYFGLNLQTPTVHADEIEKTQQVTNKDNEQIVPKNGETTTRSDSNSISKNQNLNTLKKVPQPTTVASNSKSDNTALEVNRNRVLKPTASVMYPNEKNTVEANGDGWFQVEVKSGNLTDIREGTQYQISIGQGLPLNYDRLDIKTPNFKVINNGNGTFDLTANNNYTEANFDIVASMSYAQPISVAKSLKLPITVIGDDQEIHLSTDVNLVPSPKEPESKTHPLLYYKCYGLNPTTHRIAWGIYVNYNEQELQNLDIQAKFNGDQKLIKDSIMVYTPTGSELANGINTDEYPGNTYSYTLSNLLQSESTVKSIVLKEKGPFDVDGKNYSTQPLFIYFQTQLPADISGNGSDLGAFSSSLNLNVGGISVQTPLTSPAASGNSGSSNGVDVPITVKQTKVVREIVNYYYQGTDKVAAPQYKAIPLTFTRTITKNAVTGAIISYGKWSSDQIFPAVKSPIVKGYTPNKAEILAQKVNGNINELIFNVYYQKDPATPKDNDDGNETPSKGKPSIPNKPTNSHPKTGIPIQPNEPLPVVSSPTSSTKPEKPTVSTDQTPQPHVGNHVVEKDVNKTIKNKVAIKNALPKEKAVARAGKEINTSPIGKNTITKLTAKTQTNENSTLPQTSSKKTSLSIIGLGLSIVAGLFAVIGFKQKKEN